MPRPSSHGRFSGPVSPRKPCQYGSSLTATVADVRGEPTAFEGGVEPHSRLIGSTGGPGGNNAIVLNRFEDFDASVADVFIDGGVTDTLVVEQKGTVHDHGIDSIILPLHPRPSAHNVW